MGISFIQTFRAAFTRQNFRRGSLWCFCFLLFQSFLFSFASTMQMEMGLWVRPLTLLIPITGTFLSAPLLAIALFFLFATEEKKKPFLWDTMLGRTFSIYTDTFYLTLPLMGVGVLLLFSWVIFRFIGSTPLVGPLLELLLLPVTYMCFVTLLLLPILALLVFFVALPKIFYSKPKGTSFYKTLVNDFLQTGHKALGAFFVVLAPLFILRLFFFFTMQVYMQAFVYTSTFVSHFWTLMFLQVPSCLALAPFVFAFFSTAYTMQPPPKKTASKQAIENKESK